MTSKSTFDEHITIDSPVESVWSVLADIGSIDRWNPGVKGSHRINDVDGLGGSRHCDLGGRNYLKEDVVRWDPNTALTMRITETNMPFQEADIRFTLEPLDGGSTRVTVSPIYRLRYGWFGALLDRLMVRSTYRNGMRDLLRGLKRDVESEEEMS